MSPLRAIVITACSLASLSGVAGCNNRPAQAPVESGSKPHSASRSHSAGANYLPASTIVAIRERLPSAGQSVQSRIPGVGDWLKGLLFPMLEIDGQGAISASLRPGGELLAVVWSDRAALRRRLGSGQSRLRSAHASTVPLADLYRGLPAVLVQAQLTLPVRDNKAFLKHLHQLRLLKGPTVTRWMRGETGATAVPPELAPLAEMKPALMARDRSGWIAACWQRPIQRQLFCRVAYPLGATVSGPSLAKALAKQWQSSEPSASARSRSRFYGKEQLAVFVDAEGMALVSDVASLPEARRLLERVPSKQRRDEGKGAAEFAGMASALIDGGSQLITSNTMVLERDGSDIVITARWPLTKRGRAVLAPIVKKARGQELIGNGKWNQLFWGPLRKRLDVVHPLRGHYLLPPQHFHAVIHQRGLVTLLPLLMMFRMWPDFGRSKVAQGDFSQWTDMMAKDGTRSFRVDIRDGDLLWITRKAPRPIPRAAAPAARGVTPGPGR